MESYRFLGIRPRTLKDVLQEDAQYEKLRAELEGKSFENDLTRSRGLIAAEQARYAPQMAQEDLKRQQLANMFGQIRNQYYPQLSEARLQDILSRKNLSEKRMELLENGGNMRFGGALNQGSQNSNLLPRNMGSIAGINAQIKYVDDTIQNPLTQEPFNSYEEAEQFQDNLRQELDKKLLDTPTRQFLGQAKTIKAIMNGVDFDRFKKFFGPSGIIKRNIALVKRGVFNEIEPDYEAFSQFMSQDAPSIANGMRYAFKDSVQKAAAQKYADLVTKDHWLTSPESAASAFKNLKDLFNKELDSKVKLAPQNGYYKKVFSNLNSEENKKENQNQTSPNQPITKEQAIAELKRRGLIK